MDGNRGTGPLPLRPCVRSLVRGLPKDRRGRGDHLIFFQTIPGFRPASFGANPFPAHASGRLYGASQKPAVVPPINRELRPNRCGLTGLRDTDMLFSSPAQTFKDENEEDLPASSMDAVLGVFLSVHRAHGPELSALRALEEPEGRGPRPQEDLLGSHS